MQPVKVKRGRTTIVPVSVGFDVSNDTITSQIRVDPSLSSELIATWVVSFETDGTDGEILLTLDDDVTADIVYSVGYMDLKRVSGSGALPIFNDPPVLEVLFLDSVTE